MKKEYESPLSRVVPFRFADIVTTSGGLGTGDGVDDNLDDDGD
ncbi:MAG: hypothetical protein ACOYJY_00535 [Acutalibacteraceae bacterium]|jgi:hypothetical protein